MQQRVGKPSMIVFQDGQAGSQAAAGCVSVTVSVSGSVSGGEVVSSDGEIGHTQQQKRRQTEAPSQAQERQALARLKTKALLDRQSQP